MATLNLPIPYIYGMKNESWAHFSTAPVWIRIFSILTAATTVFYAFHLVILFAFEAQVSPANWINEIYFYIACVFPVFLLLIGTLSRNKKLARIAWPAALMFGICIALNIPNSMELINIYHLQFPASLGLLIALTVYIIYFIRKKKNVLDVIKLIWLFSFAYFYIVPKFISGGHQAGWFLVAMQFIYPVMMTYGLIQFFRTPKTNENAS